MALATIFSLLAFFIALIALWLASDIVKKVDNQNEKFIQAHIASVREELRDMNKLLQKTSKMAKDHDAGQSSLNERLSDHTKALSVVHDKLSSISEQLADLDRSIPPRYRVRVVKEEQKSGSKPSIQ